MLPCERLVGCLEPAVRLDLGLGDQERQHDVESGTSNSIAFFRENDGSAEKKLLFGVGSFRPEVGLTSSGLSDAR